MDYGRDSLGRRERACLECLTATPNGLTRRPGNVRVHALADVPDSVNIGPNTVIWAFAQIMRDVVFEGDNSIGSGSYIGAETVIGRGTRLSQGVHVSDHQIVGRDCFFGPHVVFTNDKYPVANNHDYTVDPPVVEDNVSIGGGATILPGVRLGRGCVVGAGAVVTKNVPPGETWAGNPARPLRGR